MVATLSGPEMSNAVSCKLDFDWIRRQEQDKLRYNLDNSSLIHFLFLLSKKIFKVFYRMLATLLKLACVTKLLFVNTFELSIFGSENGFMFEEIKNKICLKGCDIKSKCLALEGELQSLVRFFLF